MERLKRIRENLVPRRERDLVMSCLVAFYRAGGTPRPMLEADMNEWLWPMVGNVDVTRVLECLACQGCLTAEYGARRRPVRVELTPDGVCYFETLWEECVDTWWTRGLAVAALVISIAALLLSLLRH